MATKTPIEQSLIARVASNIKNAVSNAWFGPLDPLKPAITEELKPTVLGRQFDFPVGVNTNTRPRGTEAVGFNQLRGLADSCDVLRVVIETRKDQMAKLKWKITPKDEKKDPDKRCEEISDFLQSPDQEHDWDTWLRMLMEDLFVIDAPTVYVRKTIGGQLYALEPMDGATIKRVLTPQGRTPMAPDPAYQQVLKGVPAVNYSKEELLYKPRNVRTNKIYGYSPVEQIIMTVNIALRRSIHKLQYYTEGNVPEAIVGTPADWNPDQIALFQKHWDSLNEGNTAERRHMKFVPGKLDVVMTKEEVMKDAFDEWLARIVCFAFSIEPTAFVQQQNRATAESAREAALSEGLAPIMKWTVNFMNHIVWNIFGYKDLKFDWADEQVQDPKQRADIDKIYLDAGVLLKDEVRVDLGKEPFTPEQLAQIEANKPKIFGMPGAPGADPNDPNAPPPKGGLPIPGAKPGEPAPPPKAKPGDAPVDAKVAKAGKAVPGVINADRAAIIEMREELKAVFKKFFAKQPKKLAKAIMSGIGKVEKADEDAKTKAGKIIDDLDISWDELVPDVSVVLGAVAKNGAAAGLKEVGSTIPAADGPATAWAQERSAEMVGKKWVKGALVDNPDAKWVITDSTREMIKLLTAEAIDNGSTTDELADMLAESFGFSDDRADMIARTETANADQAGQLQGYRDSGIVEGKIWTTAEDDDVSDECSMNADAGVIPLDDVFPSGDDAAPAHPRCRCAVIAVLSAEED